MLVGVVNGYFERMSRAIASHNGHLSTLIGDGILALFGAVEANPWHTDDAVRAALAMRAELAAYNAELASGGLPKLQLSIGLHRGTGIAGLVGSAELMQFTVVGTVVSVAARVQALTREHGVDVLLTADVQRALDPRFALRALPPERAEGILGAGRDLRPARAGRARTRTLSESRTKLRSLSTSTSQSSREAPGRCEPSGSTGRRVGPQHRWLRS